MKTEDPQLLFKDLCARLPYGVKVVAVNNDHNDDLDNYAEIYEEIDYINCRLNEILVNGYEFGIDHVKPCYFPIEFLTKPITIASYNDGKPFVPIMEIMALRGFSYWEFITNPEEPADVIVKLRHEDDSTFIDDFSPLVLNFTSYLNMPFFVTEVLHKFHINYRLPAHLFVPVTETFNPYAK